MVTGASDGIGKQYARQLAKEGFKIALMARDMTKLEQVAAEIESEHKVKTKIIVYDFAKLATQQSVDELEALLKLELADIDQLSILVNNVGCSKAALLGKHTPADAMRLINVNINSQVYMTRLLLPRLLARQSRSALINTASRSALVPSGFTPIYCATKSFNLSFSQCMLDAHSDKIDVLTVTPHFTKTGLMPGGQCWAVSAERHAKATINQLGW